MAELIGARLLDPSGRPGPVVHDVRLVQDGPVHELTGRAAFRVAGLVVGRGALGGHLGYGDRDVTGPALLRWLFGAMSRRARYVPWDLIVGVERGVVRISCRYDELPGTGADGERTT